MTATEHHVAAEDDDPRQRQPNRKRGFGKIDRRRQRLETVACGCGEDVRPKVVEDAIESAVIGANSVETQTHLPRGIATLNAIDAAALIALCPDEQRLVPKVDLKHILELEQVLTKSPQHTVSSPG